MNDRKYIQHHLKHLLKNILPQSLTIPFDISVFSGIGNRNYDDEELGRSFFEEILEMLYEIRPRLDFSFSLYQIPAQGEGWHDRFVLTNNLMIEASGGFSVFGPVERDIKAQKDCNFHICQPILDKNGDTEDYYNWIKKTSVESHKESRYQHRRFANTENRYNRLCYLQIEYSLFNIPYSKSICKSTLGISHTFFPASSSNSLFPKDVV